ncbi:MAG: hypothetical protein JOZ77_10965 [Candidatus Eremiobacteraeota bacterium]|nr:hypothetical protein [Candidatus Eremiobacteraeota bacterium]
MKSITAGLVLGIAMLMGAMQPALAQSSMSSSMMAMPHCAANDPVVGVNMNTKMYMTRAQMMAKSSGMTPAQKQAMMAKNHVKLMCKSQATAMGAKMMASPPM